MNFRMDNHAIRIDTRMHRASVLEDDYSAQEGLMRAASAAADAPDLYAPAAPRVPRSRSAAPLVGPLLGVLSLMAVAAAAAVALMWGAR